MSAEKNRKSIQVYGGDPSKALECTECHRKQPEVEFRIWRKVCTKCVSILEKTRYKQSKEHKITQEVEKRLGELNLNPAIVAHETEIDPIIYTQYEEVSQRVEELENQLEALGLLNSRLGMEIQIKDGIIAGLRAAMMPIVSNAQPLPPIQTLMSPLANKTHLPPVHPVYGEENFESPIGITVHPQPQTTPIPFDRTLSQIAEEHTEMTLPVTPRSLQALIQTHETAILQASPPLTSTPRKSPPRFGIPNQI